MGEHLETVKKAIVDLELEDIEKIVSSALDAGEEPQAVLDAMCAGMGSVGELFDQGEYFLVDLVLAGEVMKEGLKVLEPLLEAESMGQKGTVVLFTVKGDVHDIGKNLVGTMLSTSGFKVVDLGVDVPKEKVVDAVREHSAQAIGMSVLLTSMVDSISDVVSALSAAGLRDGVKIAIGGACTTQQLADKMGVDALGRDAVEAVRIFESLCGS
ncbi:MAG: corrinoid protein [Actinobacteria bacterium]|nr:corrinoid protein [Actinomycetota bacterium]MBU4385931.1 corrinoid protein [Actinomycetota bacterium]MBU4490456.1 corrinoid protein [Actinomycetota bacterium]MCG2796201.1 corrinoid protein [Actinomycetes bacterium]